MKSWRERERDRETWRERKREWASVQSLSCVWLFETLWTAARQASLSITNSWSLLKLMSTESVMPSNHLILCRPLFLLPSIFPSNRIFSNESILCITWPECWSFSFSIMCTQGEWAWDPVFIGVKGRVWNAHFLLVILKPNSRNLKYRKRNKPSSPNGQWLKSTKVSKKKNFYVGSWAWLLHPVASKVFIWDSLLWSGCLVEQDALAIKACQSVAFKKEKEKKKAKCAGLLKFALLESRTQSTCQNFQPDVFSVQLLVMNDWAWPSYLPKVNGKALATWAGNEIPGCSQSQWDN